MSTLFPTTSTYSSETPLKDYINKLDAFSSPSSILEGFVMLAARQYSTSVFFIAGKATIQDSLSPYDGDYVPINNGIKWEPRDELRNELPHGTASWILPLGLYRVLLVSSKNEMLEPKQEIFYAIDERGNKTKLSKKEVDTLLNSGIPLPVPAGLFTIPFQKL